jgi:hypothetical protein
VFFQQREDMLVMPAGMAELDRHSYPARDLPEEIRQPGIVARLRRRELGQQDRPLATEFVPACLDALQPGLGRV